MTKMAAITTMMTYDDNNNDSHDFYIPSNCISFLKNNNCFTTMKIKKMITKGESLGILIASICFPNLASSNTIIQSTCIFCLTLVVRCNSLYHLAYFRTFLRHQSLRLTLWISQCPRSIAQFWR